MKPCQIITRCWIREPARKRGTRWTPREQEGKGPVLGVLSGGFAPESLVWSQQTSPFFPSNKRWISKYLEYSRTKTLTVRSGFVVGGEQRCFSREREVRLGWALLSNEGGLPEQLPKLEGGRLVRLSKLGSNCLRYLTGFTDAWGQEGITAKSPSLASRPLYFGSFSNYLQFPVLHNARLNLCFLASIEYWCSRFEGCTPDIISAIIATSYIKSKNWQGEAKRLIRGGETRNWKRGRTYLVDLTSPMRTIRPLKKLRYEPQGSEVFHCSSMGIYAERIAPGEGDTKSR
jgi:hypothetical protein